jgi:hypothetical protein
MQMHLLSKQTLFPFRQQENCALENKVENINRLKYFMTKLLQTEIYFHNNNKSYENEYLYHQQRYNIPCWSVIFLT